MPTRIKYPTKTVKRGSDIAKEVMNEIFHAFDEAGHDKSNLVGDVFFGISTQLDNAFGNEN